MGPSFSPRYDRQTMLSEIGEEGQARLYTATVMIVGLGGLGSPVALYLAAAGVGELVLVDDDLVSETNLQRQVLYTTAELGQPKATCAARRCEAINPEVRTLSLRRRFSADMVQAVKDCNIVVDCTDNHAARFAIDDVCRQIGRPWVHAAIEGFEGRVSLFNGRARTSYADLFGADRDALCSAPARPAGVIGPTPGVLGSMQAAEALKWLAGIPSPLDGAIFHINLLNYQTNLIQI